MDGRRWKEGVAGVGNKKGRGRKVDVRRRKEGEEGGGNKKGTRSERGGS